MPPTARRRRTAQNEESSEEERPRNTQASQARRGTQRNIDDDDEEEDDEEVNGGDGMDVDGQDSQDQLVKKLVRYALACEYQRLPIRRAGISEKVFGRQRGKFKRTFDGAQYQLRTKFGMEMIELPAKDKITLKERRAAQKSKNGGVSSSTSYVLTSILPEIYRTTDIIPPSKIGNPAEEAAYAGIYSFIVTIIALSPAGVLSESKLKRHLERVNARDVFPMDKTDAILAKLIRQLYIVRTVERSESDETIEYRVGPRGKIEIGNKGIQGLVKEVYGDNAPDDLDKRLRRSLGIETAEDMEVDEDEEEQSQEQPQVSVDPGPSRRTGRR